MLTLKTAPAQAAVSDPEVLAHLRLEATAFDLEPDLRGKIEAAVADVENATGRQLVTAVWQLVLRSFPPGDCLLFPRPPLQSVVSVTYRDAALATQTFAATNYVVQAPAGDRALPGRIVLQPESSWPDIGNAIDAVTIEWKAGYGDNPANVPGFLRAMVLLRLGELYDRRLDEPTVDLARILSGWRVL